MRYALQDISFQVDLIAEILPTEQIDQKQVNPVENSLSKNYFSDLQ